jgi:hypothetical protein
MAGTIDRATLDRLIALGRVRGELTASEFQAALPVDTLDVDALVLVMLELEAAGISVEPDALGPRPETVTTPAFTRARPPADPPAPPNAAGDASRPPPAPAMAPRAEAGTAGGSPEDESVGRVVLIAGVTLLIVLGVILVLL